MAVLSNSKTWPNGRVPYEAENVEIERWLLEINAAVGYPILVPKGVSDSDYIRAQRGNGQSESIGYEKNSGACLITANNKSTMQHELLHALGFHHEQLHKNGPWGAFGTKASSASRIDANLLTAFGKGMLDADAISAEAAAHSKSAVRPGSGRRNSISAGDKVVVSVNQEAIDQHKRAYDEAVTSNSIEHRDACDFDSVMMYPEMTKAAEAVKLGDKVTKTGKHPRAPSLSNGDVNALQYLYPCHIVTLYTPPPFGK
jgi:hypothetical protein